MAWHRMQVAKLVITLATGLFLLFRLSYVWHTIANASRPKTADVAVFAYPIAQAAFSISYAARAYHIRRAGWILILLNLALDVFLMKITYRLPLR